jgi:CRP/FNR family transcriptional regulator
MGPEMPASPRRRGVAQAFSGGRASGKSPALTAARGRRALSRLAEEGEFLALRPGELLVEEGGRSDDAHLVVEGALALAKSLPGGRRQGVGFRFPGELVHYQARDGLCSAAVRAVGAAKVRRFPWPALRRLCQTNGDVCRLLLDLAGNEIAARQRQLLIVGRANKEERLAAFLAELWARLGPVPGCPHELVLPMRRREIAEYLGLSAEAVSRGFTRLAKAGVLTLSGWRRIRILDQARLESLAASRLAGCGCGPAPSDPGS